MALAERWVLLVRRSYRGIPGTTASLVLLIAPRHAKLAAYEPELIGLVQAVRHWRPYLWGREFVIRMDH